MNQDFKFKTHPVVIDPYDRVVQEALNEIDPSLKKDIDVIKLEPTSKGPNVLGWVTNEDLFKGKPGKQRVIHIPLNKIKQDFKKMYNKPYQISNLDHQNQMKEIVKVFLRDSIIPHEKSHIEDMVRGKGEFGPSTEQKAQKAEDWSNLKDLGIQKKAQRVVRRYFG